MRLEAIAGLGPCVHCGFCLQSCPTYRVSNDEAESPRGRIVLIEALAAQRLAPTDPTMVLHLDQCLGCRACEPVCPSGVEYGPAIEDARRVLAEHRPIPLVVRLLHAVIGEPLVRRPAFTAARLVRPLTRQASGTSRLATAMAMLAATSPWRPTRERAQAAAEHPPSSPIPDRGPVALFHGCVMDDLFGHVHAATIRVLTANGYRVIEIDGQTCCGALHAHAGQHDDAIRLARANSAAFSTLAPDVPVAVDAAGCGAILKDYGRLLAGSRSADAARSLAVRIRDVTELLATAGPRTGAPLDMRVAYDPPCHLLHAQRIAEQPEAVLAAIPGIERVHHDDAELCCGSAGSYTFAQPDASRLVLALKVASLRAASPDVVVTGNPGCIMQIGAGLRSAGVDIPVVHPVELLDWSYERAGFYERG
jgi:glycolate oxidase iron-sulfur subunit